MRCELEHIGSRGRTQRMSHSSDLGLDNRFFRTQYWFGLLKNPLTHNSNHLYGLRIKLNNVRCFEFRLACSCFPPVRQEFVGFQTLIGVPRQIFKYNFGIHFFHIKTKSVKLLRSLSSTIQFTGSTIGPMTGVKFSIGLDRPRC